MRGDRALERSRVPAGLAAGRVEIGRAAGDPLRAPPADVDPVRGPRGEAVDPVAFPADPDGRVRPLEGRWIAHRAVDRVVPALEDRTRLGPHAPDDLEAFAELGDALTDAGERDPVRAILLLEPARPQPEVEPSPADDVEGGAHLGQDRRRPVRVAEHARAQANPARVPREGGQRRPAFQQRHRSRPRAPGTGAGLRDPGVLHVGVWGEGQEVIAEPDRVEIEGLRERGHAAHLLVRGHRETPDGQREDEAEVKVRTWRHASPGPAAYHTGTEGGVDGPVRRVIYVARLRCHLTSVWRKP